MKKIRERYRGMISQQTLEADLRAFERVVASRPLKPPTGSALPELVQSAAALDAARDARRAPREAFELPGAA